MKADTDKIREETIEYLKKAKEYLAEAWRLFPSNFQIPDDFGLESVKLIADKIDNLREDTVDYILWLARKAREIDEAEAIQSIKEWIRIKENRLETLLAETEE